MPAAVTLTVCCCYQITCRMWSPCASMCHIGMCSMAAKAVLSCQAVRSRLVSTADSFRLAGLGPWYCRSRRCCFFCGVSCRHSRACRPPPLVLPQLLRYFLCFPCLLHQLFMLLAPPELHRDPDAVPRLRADEVREAQLPLRHAVAGGAKILLECRRQGIQPGAEGTGQSASCEVFENCRSGTLLLVTPKSSWKRCRQGMQPGAVEGTGQPST